MSILLTWSGWQFLGALTAWLMLGCVGFSLWSAVRDTYAISRRLHKIPCANCQFFTGQPVLKCTVHPVSALSETAINCPDFQG